MWTIFTFFFGFPFFNYHFHVGFANYKCGFAKWSSIGYCTWTWLATCSFSPTSTQPFTNYVSSKKLHDYLINSMTFCFLFSKIFNLFSLFWCNHQFFPMFFLLGCDFLVYLFLFKLDKDVIVMIFSSNQLVVLQKLVTSI